MERLLYIAGYGRSGSTVLAAILGGHPDIVSVGEICFLGEDWGDPKRVCSCGATYPDCPFWGPLAEEGAELALEERVTRRTEGVGALARLPLGLIGSRERELYGRYQRLVLARARDASRRGIVLDSSKSAWRSAARPLALRRIAGEDVHVLHLIRDGSATLRSLLTTGSNWAIEGHRRPRRLAGARAVTGWMFANLVAAAMRRWLGGDRYLAVRYEDLVADPAGTLSKVGQFIGIDTGPLITRIQQGEAFPVEHMVGGNRVRFQSRIALQSHRPPDADPALPRRHRLMFALFGGWLNARYGYGHN